MKSIKGNCKLKKKFNLLFAILIIILLFACKSVDIMKTDKNEVKATFKGTISVINGDRATVLDSERGKIWVDLSVNRAVTFQVGDEIEVGYDGEIKESYPAQINTLSVELVK